MTGSFATIAAKVLLKEKKCGNALNAKITCCVVNVTKSLFTNIL